MKRQKLKLSRQTVRVLAGPDLSRAAGGMPPESWQTLCPSQHRDSLCQCDTWHDCGTDICVQ